MGKNGKVIEKKDNKASDQRLINEALQKTNITIKELQSYSSKDFTHINHKFLAFHKNNNKLQTTVINLKKILWQQDQQQHLEAVIDLFLELKLSLHEIRSVAHKNKEVFVQLFENLEYIQVPLNNYRQNLITLKLLASNFKLDIAALNLTTKESEKIKELTAFLENIGMFFPESETFLLKYQEHLEMLIETVNNILEDFLSEIEDSLSSFFGVSDHVKNDMEKAKVTYSEIEDSFKLCHKNVETIITKLQYQDIIRQRIEHVEETQEETIKNLQAEVTSDGSAELSLERILQIKQVVGLQSAHLIHINSEFQNAIDTITDTIKKYNSNLDNVIDKSVKFSKTISHFDNLVNMDNDGLGKVFLVLDQLGDTLKEVSAEVNVLESKKPSLINYFNEINDITKQVSKIKNSIKSVSNEGTLKKIFSLLESCENLQEKVSKGFEIFNTNLLDIGHNKKSLTATYTEINAVAKNYNKETVNGIYASFDKEKALMVNEISNTKGAIKDISGTLHELKYYQFFEAGVQEIIQYMDEIKSAFAGITADDKDINEKLEHIKKRYTTTIEHDVHSQFSLKEENQIDELVNNLDAVEDSDDVEFF